MKKLHRAFNVFSCFQTRKKGATEPNSLSHFKACEKRPVGVLIRFLVFKLMKKRPNRVFSLIGSIIFVVGKSPMDIMELIFV
ncbi:Uncharacterised protein [Streptococcus pneumoniae]|nr:Uncharacterised protein [Streptococcus pneumoniae]